MKSILKKLFLVYNEPKSKREQKIQADGIPMASKKTSSEGIGVFITEQSIVSFPVASGVVLTISNVLKRIFPLLPSSDLLILLIAFVVGFVIFLISLVVSDKQPKPLEIIIRFFIAIFNSFFLAAAALGIDYSFPS